jgi:hypothetical protein
MREHVLLDFFRGRLDATALSRDLEGSIVRVGHDQAGVRIVDLPGGEHEVTAEGLVRVCDAVERRLLDPWMLEAIGFCLLASDHFRWDPGTPDGARVAIVIGYWSAPLANFPLTPRTVAKARHLLLTGEDTFGAEDLEKAPLRAWSAARMTKVLERELLPG